MFHRLKTLFSNHDDDLPKANAIDPYQERWKKDERKRQEERAAREEAEMQGREAIDALSNSTPISVLPSQSNSSHFPPATPVGLSPAADIDTTPVPPTATPRRPNPTPGMLAFQAVHGTVHQFTGQPGRNNNLKNDMESLYSRCEVLLQCLDEISLDTTTSPQHKHELARIRGEVENTRDYLVKQSNSSKFQQHKDGHMEIARIERKIGQDFTSFGVISQGLNGPKIDQIRQILEQLCQKLDAPPDMQNTDPNNVWQVDDLEFKRHIKNLLGYEPKSSFVLKGRIYDRDIVPISRGISFDVYKAWMAPKERVALKIYGERISTNGEGIEFVRRMMRHAELWRSFQHDSVLECYGVNMQLVKDSDSGDDRIQFYLVSPFLRQGNAKNYIKKRRQNNLPVDIMQIIKQAALGIQYLHDRHEPCVHASIRGENVLIKEDGTACINGFGLTKALSLTGSKIQLTGKTPPYQWMAPELINHPSHPPLEPSCDIWSWAMASLELISGVQPYHRFRERDIAVEIVAGHLPNESDYPGFRQYAPQPDMMWALLQKCWEMDPKTRPTISQVIDELERIEKA